jgi:hypothetical protein
MKILIHLTVLIAVLLIPTGCAKRETWDYLVMGVMSRASMSFIPQQFAAHIQDELGVDVVIHEQERWEPKEILENLRSNDDLRELVKNAEVVTFDFHLEFLNAPEAKYSSKLYGGDDNQDCLREALAVEKENVAAILDLLAELRAGSPVLLRVFIIDDHYYQFSLPNVPTPLVKPEVAEVLKIYYHDLQQFVEEEGQARGIVVVRALPDPYFQDSKPPAEWLDFIGHYTEAGSRVITDELVKLGLEMTVLK